MKNNEQLIKSYQDVIIKGEITIAKLEKRIMSDSNTIRIERNKVFKARKLLKWLEHKKK